MGKYYYGRKSMIVFNTLHPDLQMLCRQLIMLKDLSLLEGHRSDARQEELFAAGKTKVRAGKSKHNPYPAEAVDMIPCPFDATDWKDRDKFHLHAGFVLGVADMLYEQGLMKCHIRWGGDWDKDWETSDNEFDDFPHIELI